MEVVSLRRSLVGREKRTSCLIELTGSGLLRARRRRPPPRERVFVEVLSTCLSCVGEDQAIPAREEGLGQWGISRRVVFHTRRFPGASPPETPLGSAPCAVVLAVPWPPPHHPCYTRVSSD